MTGLSVSSGSASVKLSGATTVSVTLITKEATAQSWRSNRREGGKG